MHGCAQGHSNLVSGLLACSHPPATQSRSGMLVAVTYESFDLLHYPSRNLCSLASCSLRDIRNLIPNISGRAVRCGMVRYHAVPVQYSTVPCRAGAVRYGTMPCRCSAVRYHAVPVRCSTVRYGAVRCGAVPCRAVRYGTVPYGAVITNTICFVTLLLPCMMGRLLQGGRLLHHISTPCLGN